MSAPEFFVGQVLLFVPRDRRLGAASNVAVTKVGRKWIECGHRLRIDRHSMAADGRGFTSPGKCFLTAADYEDQMLRARVWNHLRSLVGNCYAAPDVPIESMQKAAALLFPEQQT